MSWWAGSLLLFSGLSGAVCGLAANVALGGCSRRGGPLVGAAVAFLVAGFLAAAFWNFLFV